MHIDFNFSFASFRWSIKNIKQHQVDKHAYIPINYGTKIKRHIHSINQIIGIPSIYLLRKEVT